MERLITVSFCCRVAPGKDVLLLASYNGSSGDFHCHSASYSRIILGTRLSGADMKLELSTFLVVSGINC